MVLFDNLKPVVLGRDSAGQPQWNPRFLDFALALGFHPRACQPYRAQTKGRVERTIGYLRQHFWPGRTFTDLADLNQQVQAWVSGVANRRLHGTTGRRPMELLREEGLTPLPSRAVWEIYLTEERKVSRNGFVSFGGSRYGVPWTLAGCSVEVRELGQHIEILYQGRRVAVHPKAVWPGAEVLSPGQWQGLPLGESAPKRKSVALKVPAPEVEVRPLAVYEALLGGEGR